MIISFPAKAGVIQTSHIFIFSVVICEINFGNVNFADIWRKNVKIIDKCCMQSINIYMLSTYMLEMLKWLEVQAVKTSWTSFHCQLQISTYVSMKKELFELLDISWLREGVVTKSLILSCSGIDMKMTFPFTFYQNFLWKSLKLQKHFIKIIKIYTSPFPWKYSIW